MCGAAPTRLNRTRRTSAELVDVVRGLPVDPATLRSVLRVLTDIGSTAGGFRTTGTPEDAEVAHWIAGMFRACGLVDVAIEPVPVDSWRFRAASLSDPSGRWSLRAGSLGGVPSTPPNGVTGRLIVVRDPKRRNLDRVDVTGALVLVEWSSAQVEPVVFALELAHRGAAGMIVTCPLGGPWFQTPDALGCFDGHWPVGGLPMVMISQLDAGVLRQRAVGEPVTLVVDVALDPAAIGHTVVGYLPGELPGPIVVGAHHDGWHTGAFDNASGVAALAALAESLCGSGFRPRHTICFTARTAEEYGLIGAFGDWCIGAWHQISAAHPQWATGSPFHLCLEASGRPGLRTVIEAPTELRRWAGRICRAADLQGWTPTGWRLGPPVTGTEQWPFLISGVPGVAAYSWENSFARTDYHTQHDTLNKLDLEVLAAQTRLYALLLLSADEDPDVILDHRARARELARIADTTGHPGLAVAAARHRRATGRAAFTQVGRTVLAVDAHGGTTSAHRQAQKDVAALDFALHALNALQTAGARPTPATASTDPPPSAVPPPADLARAARALSRMGPHHLHPYLSTGPLAAYQELEHAGGDRSWSSASRLTRSPLLGPELAALRREPGSRPYGDWVPQSLRRALADSRRELRRRLDEMADGIGQVAPAGQETADEGQTHPAPAPPELPLQPGDRDDRTGGADLR